MGSTYLVSLDRLLHRRLFFVSFLVVQDSADAVNTLRVRGVRVHRACFALSRLFDMVETLAVPALELFDVFVRWHGCRCVGYFTGF